MSRLVEFYAGHGTDAEGRRLRTILAWDDAEWEEVHDFIQWLFPLPEVSNFNADAPVLTPEDIAAFAADPALRANLTTSFDRWLRFAGLALDGEGRVVPGANFAARAPEVWEEPNHNWLRVTRVLRSLALLGLPDQARALYWWLREHFRDGAVAESAETFGYWTKAINNAK